MSLPRLRVAASGRFLETETGAPFFWLGDTAWSLFHRCDEVEIQRYLANRAAKGFNVIQAAVLAELRGLVQPSAMGHLPLVDQDPARPNEAYLRHVDYAVDLAASLGMYTCLLPCWGAYITKPWWDGKVLFDTPEKARAWGGYLARRYRDRPVIWMLGGDREYTGVEPIIEAMAQGIRAEVGRSQLITVHPYGFYSSSAWFHGAEWLDFNTVQSGHFRKFGPNQELIQGDWALSPAKPTLDAEPCYENHYVGFNGQNGLFDDYDVRVAAYRSVFAGGAGITYGCGQMWQFWKPGTDMPQALGCPSTSWQDVLNLPGSSQLRHLVRLLRSRPGVSRHPDAAVAKIGWDHAWDRRHQASQVASNIAACRDGTPGAADATWIMVYMPQTMGLQVDTRCLPGKRLRYWWFDPVEGLAFPNPECDNTGRLEATWHWLPWQVKTSARDWVLVVDDAAAGYGAPV